VERRELGPNRQSGPDFKLSLAGKDYALDLTNAIVDQPTNLLQAATTDLFHAARAEQRKADTYAEELALSNCQLLTLCFESTGAISSQFNSFWSILRTHFRANDMDPQWPSSFATPSFVSYAKQRMSVVHARQTLRVIRQRVAAWRAEQSGAEPAALAAELSGVS
jgi:hypothetical protein